MMKLSDVKTATALIIAGYLRSNDDADATLAEVLSAIRDEINDWAEDTNAASVFNHIGPIARFLRPGDVDALLESLADHEESGAILATIDDLKELRTSL